jgi:hypothetical protein
MKKIQLSIVFLVCVLFLQAQLPVWCFYHQQARGEGVTKIMVPGLVFKISSNFIGDKNMAHLVRKMGTVRIVAAEGKGNTFSPVESKRFINKVHRYNYEDLIAIKDGRERVHIMIKERKGKIRRYLIFIDSEDDSVMISGKCKLSVTDFMALADTKKGEWREKILSQK